MGYHFLGQSGLIHTEITTLHESPSKKYVDPNQKTKKSLPIRLKLEHCLTLQAETGFITPSLLAKCGSQYTTISLPPVIRSCATKESDKAKLGERASMSGRGGLKCSQLEAGGWPLVSPLAKKLDVLTANIISGMLSQRKKASCLPLACVCGTHTK